MNWKGAYIGGASRGRYIQGVHPGGLHHGMTNACENITSSILRMRSVKIPENLLKPGDHPAKRWNFVTLEIWEPEEKFVYLKKNY